jgi:hypothetical protein
MDIFLTLALRNSANPNDAADNTTAVRDIKLYALAVGNDAACLLGKLLHELAERNDRLEQHHH